MPARLPDELRQRGVWLWVLGYVLEDIAKQLGVHVSSVRNFVNELRQGRFPEYEWFLPRRHAPPSARNESQSDGVRASCYGLHGLHGFG